MPVKQIKRVEKVAKLFKLEIDNFGNINLYYIPDKNSKPLIVPRLEERENLIRSAHLLGHFQTDSTLKRLQEQYFWKNMREQVERIVKSCVECYRHHKVPVIEHEAKALEISSIFDRVGIDLTLGFPETKEGFIGLLVMTEYLTKFVVAYPIKSKTASEIAERLFDYISFFGPPKEILSDQGTEFNNQVVNALLKISGVEHRVTSPYHPRTNGLTERVNGIIVESIKKHASTNILEWNKWIPYVLLAYRTKIHSSTGFTPFELLYGRKVKIFNDFSKIRIDESELIWKRSLEIKQLVDIVHPKAIENIAKSQQRQIKAQNNSKNISNEILPIGSQVYVKTTGLHNKLFDEYKGPFTVVEHTHGGNYKLKNALNQLLEGSFVRSRLKPTNLVYNDKFYKIDKILDDRMNEKGIREFLVKWDDNDLGAPSWEPAENFVDLDIINKYLKNKDKIVPQIKEKNQNQQNETGKRGRGRPRKINSINLVTILYLIFIFLPIISSSPIKGNFMYCKSNENHDFQLPFIDIYSSCQTRENEDKILNNLKENWQSNVHLLNKIPNKVKGIGYECSKIAITIKTYMNIIRGRSSEPPEIKIIEMNREECEIMVKTKKCEQNKMECDGPVCMFNGTPEPEFYYLSEFTKTGVSCRFQNKLIMATDENDNLFGTECKGRDLFCNLGRSVIIWNKEIILKCEYEYIKTMSNTSVVDENIIYESNNQWAFQIIRKINVCKDLIKNGLDLYQTTEGLYLSLDKTVNELPKSELSLTNLHELMLSEEDGHKIAELLDFKKLNKKICESNLMTLRYISNLDDHFEVLNIANTTTIIYSNEGIITIPICIKVKEIVPIPSTGNICYKYIPILFKTEDNFTTGFITPNKIIRKHSPKVNCGKITSVYLNDSKTLLYYDGKQVFLRKNPQVIKVEDLVEISSKLNLVHYNEIVNEIDVFKIIHWDNTRSVSNKSDKDIIIQDFKIDYQGTGFGIWLNEKYEWIKNEFNKELIIIGSIVSIVAILIIIILILIKKGARKRRKVKIDESENDEENVKESDQENGHEEIEMHPKLSRNSSRKVSWNTSKNIPRNNKRRQSVTFDSVSEDEGMDHDKVDMDILRSIGIAT